MTRYWPGHPEGCCCEACDAGRFPPTKAQTRDTAKPKRQLTPETIERWRQEDDENDFHYGFGKD